MNSTTDLPDQVVSAIHAGRKIEAIKLLREARGLGLKEAKHAVDAYVRENLSVQQPQSGSNGLIIVVIVILVLVWLFFR